MRHLFIALCLPFVLMACSKKEAASIKPPPLSPSWNPKISKFSNCEQINTYLQSYWTDHSSDPLSSSAAEHYQPQVDGVDEGDILQSNSNFYFFSRPGSVEIIDRTQLTTVKSIPIAKMPFHWIFYSDRKLISVTGDNHWTWIRIFDEGRNFETVSETTLSGEPLDFRYVDGSLVLVARLFANEVPDSVDCSQIYRPNLENGSSGMTFIYKVPVAAPSQAIQSLLLWGQTNFFYMTRQELFLFQSFYTQSNQMQTGFRVVNWSSGLPSLIQASAIEGEMKDRSAVFQKDSFLIMAATARNFHFSAFSTSNFVTAYKKGENGEYQRISKSESFAPNEDIRAVRFLNDKAYVVTFEKTDPLFVLDIQDPKHIQILSELKSPGFSTQLRPLPDGTLVGIGFDTKSDAGFSWFGGIKATLFDVQNPLAPTETSTLKFGDRGSYSEAVFDPKGFYVSNSGVQALLPVVEIAKDPDDTQPWSLGTRHLFSGAVLLDISNHQITERYRYTHQTWRESVCGTDAFAALSWWANPTPSLDIQRALMTHNCVDTFSRFGVMRFCSSNNSPTSSLKFKNSVSLCRPD